MALAKSLVLMSPMEGHLVYEDGSPASGIRLTRTWDWAWTGQTGQDETVTDAEGWFHFGVLTGRSMTARFIPHQPDIRQTITARTQTDDVLIWAASKGNYDFNGELRGKSLNVICGINALPGPESRKLFRGTCIAATP